MTRFIGKNNNGFSMVELIVVLAIVGLMSLGTTALVNNLVKLNTKSKAKSTLFSLKDQMMKTLKDEVSWAETVRGNASLICLDENSVDECAHNTIIDNFDVFNRQGVAFYMASDVSQGFNNEAASCNNFSGGGNDDCPYRYDIRLTLECNFNDDFCKTPTLRIQADFKYSPGTDGHIANTLELVDQGADPWAARGKMDFEFQKSRPDKIDSFQVMFATQNTPGGDCISGAWTIRPLNYINFNSNGVLRELNTAQSWMQMKTGPYTCEIKAEAYGAVDGFKVRLTNLDAPYSEVTATGYSDEASSTIAVGSVDFEVSSTTHRYQIQHYCQIDNPSHDFDMGIPKPTYGVDADGIGINRYTIITCTRKG